MALPLEKYEPIIHATIYLTGVTYRFATVDYYDVTDNYFKGTLLSDPQLTRQLSDLYYGVEDSKSVTLSFSNGDNGIDPTWDVIVETNAKELRGRSVLVERYDPNDGTTFEIRGVITDYSLGPTVDITIEMRDDYTLETLLPLDVVTASVFTPTALNLGEPINLCLGYCRNVPLRNIKNSDSITISDISQDDPGKVTTSAVHDLTTGDYVFFTFIEGMTELNSLPDDAATLYQITVVDDDEFTLDGIDTNGYGAYTAGGNMHPRKYDYLIGYGTMEGLWVDHANGLGVRRDGVLVDTGEYTFHDGAGTPYTGYAFIRFLVEQSDFSGNFMSISADVKGLELGGSITNRNFATILKNILSNATWGLGDSVDNASFAAAATALNELGYEITDVDTGTEQFEIAGDHEAFFIADRRFRVIDSTGNDGDWTVSSSSHAAGTTTITVTGNVTDATVDGYIDRMYCDGPVAKQQKARDIINKILEPARARIWRNTDGEWEIAIDVTGGASVLGLGDNDGYYNNCEVVSASATPMNNVLQTAIVQYSQDPANDENPFKELSVAVHTGFGEERTYELPFVMEDDTAVMVLSYLKNRSLYSDKIVSIRGGMECRDLSEGSIVTLTAPARDISAREYMIQSITKGIASFDMECREYSASIYTTETIASPTFFDSTGVTVHGAASMVGTITLGDGIGPGQILLKIAAGQGDTYIAAGKNDFVTTTNGFILGIDDSDADKVKFYLGDPTENLYWDGSNLYITGTITATAGVIGGWIISATALADNAVAANANIYIDSANTLIRVGPTTGKYLTIDGANLRIRSSNYVAGMAGAGFTLEPDLLEVGNIAARGIMRTAVFQKDVISCVGGNLAVLPADVLATDMTALDAADVVIEGNETFVNGDLLRIRTGSGVAGDGSDDDEWFEVTNAAGAPTYVVDRDKGTDYGVDSNPTWPKGAAVVNYGQSGDGLVYMTASDTNAPYLTVMTHAGAPWTALSEKVRIGNLNGYAGYAADIYGVAIYEDANNYLLFDPTNGIRIASNTSDAITIKDGGVITLEAGGDILMKKGLTSSQMIWEMGADASTTILETSSTTNNFALHPSEDNVGQFVVGKTPAFVDAKWLTITLKSKDAQDFYTYYDANHYTRIQGYAAASAGILTFSIKDTNFYSIQFDANDTPAVFGPLAPGTVNLGNTDHLWSCGWFNNYVIALGGIHVGGTSDPGTDNLVVDGLISADGGQIAFPAGAVPSADPNTLDDYQEGTYDMTITCVTSGTVTVNPARNTVMFEKIGRQVTVHGRFSISAIDAPLGIGQLLLPFTAIAGGEDEGVSTGSCAVNAVNFLGTWVVPDVQENVLYFIMMGSTDNAGWIEESANIWGVGSYMDFAVTYTAA